MLLILEKINAKNIAEVLECWIRCRLHGHDEMIDWRIMFHFTEFFTLLISTSSCFIIIKNRFQYIYKVSTLDKEANNYVNLRGWAFVSLKPTRHENLPMISIIHSSFKVDKRQATFSIFFQPELFSSLFFFHLVDIVLEFLSKARKQGQHVEKHKRRTTKISSHHLISCGYQFRIFFKVWRCLSS